MAASSSKEALRLIPCFCRGCPDLTEDEIKTFLAHKIEETLEDAKAAKLLRKYFETRQKGDASMGHQMLDVYEKISQYQADSTSITEDEVDELFDLGLPINYKRALAKCIDNPEETSECLKEIQEMCQHEMSHDYKSFKHELKRKLRRRFTRRN